VWTAFWSAARHELASSLAAGTGSLMDERWSHLVQDPAVLLESAMCYTVGDGTYQEQGAMLERQFHMVVCLPTSRWKSYDYAVGRLSLEGPFLCPTASHSSVQQHPSTTTQDRSSKLPSVASR
jgi:hypothetical protein